jgi:hypothetical protein
MEPIFQDHPSFVDWLTQIDRWLGVVPGFRGVADHVLLRFVREEK